LKEGLRQQGTIASIDFKIYRYRDDKSYKQRMLDLIAMTRSDGNLIEMTSTYSENDRHRMRYPPATKENVMATIVKCCDLYDAACDQYDAQHAGR